jgi:FtsH-binding integral membrane protein
LALKADGRAMCRGGTKLSAADDRVPDDFADMLETAARDHRVTALNVSRQQVRSGAYGLLGAALFFAFTALFAAFPWILVPIGEFRPAVIGLYLCVSLTFLGLFFLTRQDPVVPALVGLILFCLLVVPAIVIIAIDLAWVVGLVVLLALVDGLRAAIHHRRILRAALQNSEGTESALDQS